MHRCCSVSVGHELYSRRFGPSRSPVDVHKDGGHYCGPASRQYSWTHSLKPWMPSLIAITCCAICQQPLYGLQRAL